MHQDEILMVISTMRSTRYDKKFVHLHGSNKKGTALSRRPFQLVEKPSLWGQRFIYAGGARGGKARLESDQMSRKALPCKACVERSDYFCAARRHKNNDIISGCRKSLWLFRQPEGRYHWELSAPPKGSLGWNVPSSSGWGCSGKYPMPLMFLICRK